MILALVAIACEVWTFPCMRMLAKDTFERTFDRFHAPFCVHIYKNTIRTRRAGLLRLHTCICTETLFKSG